MSAIGSFSRNVITQNLTASGNINMDSDQVLCDCTSGAITATLYASPGDLAYHRVIVQKTDSGGNAVTVTDGTFSFSLSAQYDAVTCEMTEDGVWIGISGFDVTGTGDVDGPGSATSANLASFSGTTGKIIQDSGVATTQVSTNASTAASATLSGTSATASVAASATLSGTSATASVAGSATLSGVSATASVAGSAVLSGVSGTASVASSQVASQSLILSVTTSTANSG